MNRPEVKVWRREARQKLLAARAALAAPVRERLTNGLIAQLRPVLKRRPEPISFYWPIKAEPDLKPLMRELDAAGVEVCLPVCIKLGTPLVFRRWTKGARMERGFWDIPIPADPTEVQPRTLIAPLVGYDGSSYRLGYGGGFFDRTLAKLGDGAAAIGIGYSMFRLETIEPQPHDIRMAAIVTEHGEASPSAMHSASNVCSLEEAPDSYAGFASRDEIAAVLEAIRPTLPQERVALADYALWRLGAGSTGAAAAPAPREALALMLPRIRDDTLHATLAALSASLEV